MLKGARRKMLKYKLIIINSQYNLFHIRSHEMQIDRNFHTKYWNFLKSMRGGGRRGKKFIKTSREQPWNDREGSWSRLEFMSVETLSSWLSRVINEKPWTIIVSKAKCKNAFERNKHEERKEKSSLKQKPFKIIKSRITKTIRLSGDRAQNIFITNIDLV